MLESMVMESITVKRTIETVDVALEAFGILWRHSGKRLRYLRYMGSDAC
jgi:hypothetical protein